MEQQKTTNWRKSLLTIEYLTLHEQVVNLVNVSEFLPHCHAWVVNVAKKQQNVTAFFDHGASYTGNAMEVGAVSRR